jgi:hypothetical protein
MIVAKKKKKKKIAQYLPSDGDQIQRQLNKLTLALQNKL